MKAKPRSILCVPVIHQGRLGGLLYLENNLTPGAFTAKSIKILDVIASQAAIALENARLYRERSAALVETVITWRAEDAPDGTFSTQGVDSDQLAAAVIATEKALNAVALRPRRAARARRGARASARASG